MPPRVFFHENGNIPKSAIMVMALCFRRLVFSENVLPRFKRYVRDILLRLLKDTNERPGMKPWSEMIVTALAMGDFDRSAASRQYQIALTELLSNVDLSIEREARMLIEAVGRVQGMSSV